MVNPDKLALVERWTDQAALDAHTRLHSKLPPFSPELRADTTECERYIQPDPVIRISTEDRKQFPPSVTGTAR